MNIIEPQTLKQDYTPQHIINRAYEQELLYETIAAHRPASLYIHGPRGTGKTLVTRATLDRIDDPVEAYYAPVWSTIPSTKC